MAVDTVKASNPWKVWASICRAMVERWSDTLCAGRLADFLDGVQG